MDFSLIPTAEASITTLVNSINKVIINPIIIFLFAAALAYFLYGVAQYLISPDNEEIRKKSKSQIFSGLIGLFIMVAVFGIMTLIKNTVGAKNIQIQQSGVVKVTDFQASSTGTSGQSTGTDSQLTGDNSQSTGTSVQSSGGTDSQLTGDDSQATGGDILQATGPWLTFTGDNGQDTGVVGQATSGVNQSTSPDALNPFPRSTKKSELIGKYKSDSLYYRVVDSGVDPVLAKAESIALHNALTQIATLKGLDSIIGIKYRVIEQTQFALDSITGNYDSFIAIESPINDATPPSSSTSSYSYSN